MKSLFLLAIFTFLLPISAFGRVATYRLDTSGTNLTASFADASGPVYWITGTGLVSPFKSLDSIIIDNESGAEIVVNCSGGIASIPSNTSLANIYVQTKQAWALDNAGLTPYCYIRAKSGTISSGLVVVTGIGR